MDQHVFGADDDAMITEEDAYGPEAEMVMPEKQEADPAPKPAPKPVDLGVPTLSNKDKLQIVDHLLRRAQKPEFRDEAGYPLLFDQGSFWRWGGSVWEVVRHEDIRRDLMKINKWAKCRESQLFPVSNSWCKDIIGLAEVYVDEQGFFERSHLSPGVALKNVWLEATKGGIEVKDNAPSRRCRFLHDMALLDEEKARCPGWVSFLNELFAYDYDRQEKVDFLQCFLGACITGQAHVYDRAVMLLGQGANGKSVLCDVVEALFPAGSVSAVPPQDMSRLERCVSLSRSLLNLVTDIPTKDLRDAGAFKQIVSGDPIEARRLYQNAFRFRPTCGHLFSANALPATNDHSNGFFRRWVVLEFNRNFQGTGNRPRNELVEELLMERAGIMVWALKGAVKIMSDGSYFIPASHRKVEREWRNHNDQVRAFIDECVERVYDAGTRDEHGIMLECIPGSVLYGRYKQWAAIQGLGQLSNVKFSRRMKDLCGSMLSRRTSKGVEYGVELRVDNIWSEGISKRRLNEEESEDD